MKARHYAVLSLAIVFAACGNADPSILDGSDFADRLNGPSARNPYGNGDLTNPGQTDLSVFDEEDGDGTGHYSRPDGDEDGTNDGTTEEDASRYAWVKVTWDGATGSSAVNLDLHVVNANGVEIFYLNTGDADEGAFAPHPECTSFDCNGDEQNPSEAVFWEIEKLVPGNYQAWVENASDQGGTFNIEIVAGDYRVNESASVGGGQKSGTYEWVIEGAQEEADPNAPCLEQLDQLGIDYDPITISEGACVVEDAVMVNSPVNGVTYRVEYARSTTRFRTACKTAVALHKLGDVLKSQGVDTVYHNGSYNCRNVAGSSTPSQHSYGLAFDFNGFAGGGTEYSVVRHWEHNTTSPATPQGRVLYNIAHGAHQAGIFNVILTPNYNRDHDDHFHMDLGSGNFIRSASSGGETPMSFIDEFGSCDNHDH